MHRSKILGGLALASLMLVALTGCPSFIANIVGASESVQQAIDQASSGDTIKVQGSHDENVTVDKDNVTITGDNGASIDGNVTVDGNNVKISNVTITGTLDTVPGSFENLTLSNVTVEAWGDATVSGTFTCDTILQPGEGSIQSLVDNASAGDDLCVAKDSYSESVTIAGKPNLTLHGMGTPTIEGTGGSTNAAIAVNDADGTTIRGFSITNPSGRFGIWIGNFGSNPSSDVTIGNNTIEDVGQSYPADHEIVGILVDSDSNNATIQNNTIQNIVDSDSNSEGRATGISLVGRSAPVTGAQIRNNTIQSISAAPADTENNKARAIEFSTCVEEAQVENNQITNIGSATTDYAQGITITESDGVPCSSGTVGPTNFKITGNTIKNLMAGGDYKGAPRQAALFIGGYSTLGDNHKVQQNNILDGAVDRCCGDMAESLLTVNNWWGDASGPSTVDDTGASPGDSAKIDADEYVEDPKTGELADNSGSPIVKRHNASADVRFDDWAKSPF